MSGVLFRGHSTGQDNTVATILGVVGGAGGGGVTVCSP